MRKLLLSVGLLALACAVFFLLRRPAAQAEADAPAEVRQAAPEFARGTEWLQSKPLTLAALRGQVVVVHFWTFG